MTKPKPKPRGTAIEVPEGARVIRPGSTAEDAVTVTGGAYVLDVPGTFVIDGVAYDVDDAEPEAQPKP